MDQARGLLEIFLYSKADRVCTVKLIASTIIIYYNFIIIIIIFAHLNSSLKNFEYLLIN